MTKQQAGNRRRLQDAIAAWADKQPEIEHLYLHEGWSQEKLAGHYGITLGGMQKVMRRMGIRPKPRWRKGQQNGRFKDGTQSTLYRQMVAKDRCAKCPATENLCVHHKNGDHMDNTPDNLEVLCMSCHSSMHKTEWWSRRKSGQS